MKNKILNIGLLTIFLFTSKFSLAQDDILNSIIKIISPVETSALIKEIGVRYDNSILNKATNFVSYNNDFKKALNLGVYSTDLGYATIHDQSADALGFLNAVKRSAEGISLKEGNLGKFIRFNKIIVLAQNKKDLNKLLEETSATFENMSSALEAEKRSKYAALILTGGWIETYYITCQVAKQKNHPDLHNKIVEQKLILGQLLPLMQEYSKGDAGMEALTSDLTNLAKLLDKYKFGEVGEVEEKIDPETGLPVATGSNTSADFNLSTQELSNISGVVSEIRNAIVR